MNPLSRRHILGSSARPVFGALVSDSYEVLRDATVSPLGEPFAVLWSLTANHGLTVADLAVIPSVLIALALGLRSLRKKKAVGRT